MLIRLIGHFINNSQHIDKLICIKGLPEDWLFRKRDGQRELNPPFTADIDENIPKMIRHLCTPTEVVKYFPPIEKGKDGILDKMTILGVRLDYMTEAGRGMWTKIQRYMDGVLPRNAKIPEPVLVAKGQNTPFETYLPRRGITGGVELEPCEVPVVDLDVQVNVIVPQAVPVPAPVPIIVPVKQPVPVPSESEQFKCDDCDFTHSKKQGITMHRVKRHPKVRVGT